MLELRDLYFSVDFPHLHMIECCYQAREEFYACLISQ